MSEPDQLTERDLSRPGAVDGGQSEQCDSGKRGSSTTTARQIILSVIIASWPSLDAKGIKRLKTWGGQGERIDRLASTFAQGLPKWTIELGQSAWGDNHEKSDERGGGKEWVHALCRR